MKVINDSDLKLNLKKWLDTVTDDREEILVTRKGNKNLVVISQEEYNSLVETDYLLTGKNRGVLLNAVEDVKNKKLIQKDFIEE